MSYSRPEIAFKGIFTSGTDPLATLGVITANASPTTITIKDGAGNAVQAGSISFEFVTACEISLDGSTNYHYFKAGDKLSLDKVAFSQIKIKTSGQQLRYFGMYN